MSVTSDDTDKQRFDCFFNSLDLVRITLAESSAWRADDFALPANVQLHQSTTIEKGELPGQWMATCRYELQATANGKTEPGLKIAVRYTAFYTTEGSVDDSARNVLIQNARTATWPYMRFYVRSVTSDMGLTPLNVGLFKIRLNYPQPGAVRKTGSTKARPTPKAAMTKPEAIKTKTRK